MIRKNKAGRTYIGLLCACVLAVGVIAGLATDTRQWDIYSGTNDLVVPGTLSMDGKYGVTGGDATTGLMIQHAAVTSTALTIQTNTYAVSYGGGVVPSFVAMYSEDPVGTNGPYATSIVSNLAIVVVEAGKDYNYIVIGTRP